jgi:hypothetical protein
LTLIYSKFGGVFKLFGKKNHKNVGAKFASYYCSSMVWHKMIRNVIQPSSPMIDSYNPKENEGYGNENDKS